MCVCVRGREIEVEVNFLGKLTLIHLEGAVDSNSLREGAVDSDSLREGAVDSNSLKEGAVDSNSLWGVDSNSLRSIIHLQEEFDFFHFLSLYLLPDFHEIHISHVLTGVSCGRTSLLLPLPPHPLQLHQRGVLPSNFGLPSAPPYQIAPY